RRAASAKGAQPGRLYELDERFHRRYVEAGSGPRLLSLHEAVKPHAERYIRMYIALLLDTVPTAGSEHDAIVDAIRTGNAAAAQRAVQTNWRHASDRLVRAIEVMGEQGNWKSRRPTMADRKKVSKKPAAKPVDAKKTDKKVIVVVG